MTPREQIHGQLSKFHSSNRLKWWILARNGNHSQGQFEKGNIYICYLQATQIHEQESLSVKWWCASLSILHLSCPGDPGDSQISTGKKNPPSAILPTSALEASGLPLVAPGVEATPDVTHPMVFPGNRYIPKCYNTSAMNIHETIISY